LYTTLKNNVAASPFIAFKAEVGGSEYFRAFFIFALLKKSVAFCHSEECNDVAISAL
jgi:hypothetical protein